MLYEVKFDNKENTVKVEAGVLKGVPYKKLAVSH